MITLEDQIRLIADAAAAQEPAGSRRTQPSGWRALALAAAAVLVIVLVGSLLWVTRSPDAPSDPVPAPTDPVTVEYPAGTWLIPTWLPEGLAFDRAVRGGDGLPDEIVYEGTGGRVTVATGSGVPGGQTPTESVEIDGTTWQLVERPEAPDQLTLFRSGASGDVTVDSVGVARADLIRFAGELREQPSTALPRPPLPRLAVDGIEVARTGAAALRVESDGVSLALAIVTDSGQSGGSVPLRLDGRALAMSASSYGPDGTFASGVARADVAVVEFGLNDGTTIRTTPQDLSGRFVERFVLVELPGGDIGSNAVTSVVAYDANGTELARQDRLF